MVLSRFSPKRHRLLFFIPCMFCMAGLVLLFFLSSDSRRFDRYTAVYAKTLLSQDTMTLHYALADPDRVGLSDVPATLGTFSLPDAATEHLQCENISAVLASFSPERLTASQQLTLKILTDQNCREEKLTSGCMLWDQPSSTLGLLAQLPVLFAEYTFRNTEDVQTYLQLLADAKRYLEEYMSVLEEKAAAGYAPSAETLDGLLAQCESFLGAEDDTHFLQTVFSGKCEALGCFSEEELRQLSSSHLQLLQQSLFAAYHSVMERLKEIYPLAHARTGLSGYENGRTYYEAWLQYICGTDMTIEEIRRRLYLQMAADMTAAQKLDLSTLSLDDPYTALDADAMLSQLSTVIQPYFPAAATVHWTVRDVQPELRSFSSPAYYMIPPVDAYTDNTIYINPQEDLRGFSLYTTLAHEGFPGHLYQTTYFYETSPDLIRRLLSFGGYTEGWATYTESLLCELSVSTYEGARLYWLDRSLNLCLSSLLDLCIHADGWDLDRTASFLADFGITDTDAADDLYQYCIENPGNYLRYYLGCLSFLDLRSDIGQELGENFSLSDFHEAILSTGPCSFPVLTQAVREKLGLTEN